MNDASTIHLTINYASLMYDTSLIHYYNSEMYCGVYASMMYHSYHDASLMYDASMDS
jgi:hypothetical protein